MCCMVSYGSVNVVQTRLFILFFHKAFHGDERVSRASEIFDRAHQYLQRIPPVELDQILLADEELTAEETTARERERGERRRENKRLCLGLCSGE